MPQTWNDIIQSSLVELGVVEGNEPATTHELTRGLEYLQDMLDQWALEGLLVPALSHYTHTVEGTGRQVYTMSADAGESPDIEAEPPPTLEAVSYQRQGAQEPMPLIETSYLNWAEYQTSVSNWPSHFYYEKSSPVARIYFDALTIPGDFFRVSGRGFLTGAEIAGDEEHDLPRGYRRAIRLNLAVDIAAQFGVKEGLSDVTIALARIAKTNIRDRNVGPQVFRMDEAVTFKDTGALYRSRYRYRS